uniref:Uncharacterized protein n=1 Tax=Nelumbo nucifera TaxID=4432 RepID=A0A822ZMY6_NELNU|nr:TPA_asm: hypothetical protein HUJ06_003075 [Nelumbo nucifera]
MWRRVSSHLQALVSWRSAVKLDRSVISGEKILRNRALTSLSSSSAPYPFQRTAPLFSHQATSDAGNDFIGTLSFGLFLDLFSGVWLWFRLVLLFVWK